MPATSPERRPNFLIILSDEHGPMFSSTYGHAVVETPSMDRMAERGVTFDAAYCNSPLCVPSRLSFITGRYVSRVGAWDNATPLAVDTITWPYLLSPNPPKDTDGRREESGRGVRELQGK